MVGRLLAGVCGGGPIPVLGALRGMRETRGRLVGNTAIVFIVPRPARGRALFLWWGFRVARRSASGKATFLFIIPEVVFLTARLIRMAG